MSENVFHLAQLGRQSGTFVAPGAAVAATFIYPVEDPINIDLDRGSMFAKQDIGRNARNRAGSGFHGLRGSSFTLQSQVRFEDIMDILEMNFAGSISPTGTNPYTWVYNFEAVAPTLFPYTIQAGNIDATEAYQRARSCLVSSLTIGFPALTAPGAYPWTLSADVLGFDREISAFTASLSPRAGLEVVQGHLTRFYEGTTGTAFGSLSENATLKSFTATFDKHLVRRAYGSAADLATGYGFSEQASGTFEAMVAVSSGAKTDFHDIWNVAQPAALGERRWRVKATGTSTKVFQLDFRAGIMAVPYDEHDGERLFKVTGEMVDDSTLAAPAQATIINAIAAL